MVDYELIYEKAENKVLLQAERRNLTTGDVQIILDNCKMSYASNILRRLYFKQFLRRKKIKQGFGGGIKYKYILTKKGEEKIRCLKE